jgi:polar amino acid transport system substrate-binding protein
MTRRRPAMLTTAIVAVATLGVSACGTSTPDAESSPAAAAAQFADMVPPKFREDGVLTVGIDPNYPPMEYLDRGEAVGADLDLISEVSRRLGLDVEFSEDAYALLVPGVAAGRFEVAISALSVDDNDLQNANMVTYYKAGSQLAIRAPNRKKKPGPKKLCGRKVAVLEGSLQYSQLVENSANCIERGRKPIRIITYKAQAPATQAVVDKDAYGTLADSPVIQNAVENSDGALVAKGKPFKMARYGIAVKQSRDKFSRAIRKTLKSMIEDGTYEQILDDWGISQGAIKKPRVLTQRDIPEPTPLFSATPTPTFTG